MLCFGTLEKEKRLIAHFPLFPVFFFWLYATAALFDRLYEATRLLAKCASPGNDVRS